MTSEDINQRLDTAQSCYCQREALRAELTRLAQELGLTIPAHVQQKAGGMALFLRDEARRRYIAEQGFREGVRVLRDGESNPRRVKSISAIGLIYLDGLKGAFTPKKLRLLPDAQ